MNLCLFYVHVQGTNSEQDARFFNKQKKLLKTMKFPSNIGTKVYQIKRGARYKTSYSN